MKKTLLLLLLLPFFGIAQTDLVRWQSPTAERKNEATIISPDVVSADMKTTSLTSPNMEYNNGWDPTPFMLTSGWPKPSEFSGSYDPNRYIEFRIAPKTNRKIDLTAFRITYRSQGNAPKFLIRYSKSTDFNTNGKILEQETTTSQAWKTLTAYFPTEVNPVLDNQIVYIRLYVYAAYDNFHFKTGVNNSPVTIIGTTSANVPALKAVDDEATSIKNNFTVVNVISNDILASSPISSVTIASPPTNSGGSVSVNADKTIKFTAATGFTGPTSFKYTINDGSATSTATVNVNVTEPIVSALVKWNGPDTATPIVSNDNAVTKENIFAQPSSNFQILPNEGFKTTGWPTNFSKDDEKYIQVSVSPKAGYKLKLKTFDFTYFGESHIDVKRYQVRYSTDNFVTSHLLIDDATATGRVTKSLSLENVTLTKETLKIRIYGYKLMVFGDSNAPIFLANSNVLQSGNTTPTITGTVLQYDESDLNANDDDVVTKKNKPLTINVLKNDTEGTNPITNLTITSPPLASQGTVTLNSDKTITFTPASNFTGNTSFQYTITSSTKTSTATVYVTVEERTKGLVIWNGLGKTPVAAVSDTNLTAANILANGMTFSTSEGGYFLTTGAPTTLDYSKYIEVSVTPKSGYKLDATKFTFTYKSTSSQDHGPKQYQVRYSLDPTFPGNGTLLIPETTAVLDNQTTVEVNFPKGVVATQNQTLYIRLYVYNNNQYYSDYYLIHDNGGELGPTIDGIVSENNELTAIYDHVTVPANQTSTISILSNDIIGSKPLQDITISTPSPNGVAVKNALTDIKFTPTAGFSGETSFVYTLYDGYTYSSATVFVTVTPAPCIATLTPGTNYWKGYVYTYIGDNPAMTTYVGSVAEKAIFDRDLDTKVITGDVSVEPDSFCKTAPSDRFFVRYLMNTLIPAGTYNFTIGGDDGVRLYMDGALVAVSPSNTWNQHNYSNYATQITFNDSKTHEFVLEYFELTNSARVSFSYGEIKGDNIKLPYGINEWNVYGFTVPDVTLPASSYAGMYVDTNFNVDTQKMWLKDKSPSSAATWQGAPVGTDNFTITYKREGFPCGRYKIRLVNCDDVGAIYVDNNLVYNQNGYYPGPAKDIDEKFYFLNSKSKVDIILRENGAAANIAINFVDTPLAFNGIGTPPAKTSSIEIAANTTLQTDLEVCSCTIKPGVTLTVPLDKTLTVNETITVGDKGKLLIESGGSLMQTSTSKTAFTGAMDAFELQRETSGVRRYDFTRWSSPVTKTPGFSLHDLSPETLGDKYYSYNPSKGWVISYGGTQVMAPGIGYNVRAPQTFSLTVKTPFKASFTGIPNNGDYEVTPIEAQYNLIGNPYPSALNADKFITENAKAGTTIGAIYLWTHNSSPVDTDGDGIYTYSTDDYAIYSLSGGVATKKKSISTGNNNEPNGKINSGQGFFILASNSNIIKFTNDMRISAFNNQFFKTTSSNEIEKNRVWLNLTNEKGAFKQLLVGYIEGATNNWDANYDAGTMSSNAYIDFYSINDNDKLSIQGRAVPFANTDEVPLGYVTTVAGDFTISIDQVDGLFDEQAIYLEDKVSGKEIDLRAGNYTFTTTIGTFTNRFVLRYTSKTLGTGDFENVENGLVVSVKDKVIKVESSKEDIKQISVYDITGKLIYDKTKVNQTEFEIANLRATNQVLIVKIILENGHTDSKKIIIN